MVKMLLKIIVLILTVFSFSCEEKIDSNSNLKIMALLKSSTNPYFHLMWEGIKNEADRLNVKVDLYWPELESDFEYQYSKLQNEVFTYDALILSPNDINHIASYLPKIKKLGKPIVIVDVGINLPEKTDERDYFDALLGTDNEHGGVLAAEFALKYLSSKSKLTILGGFPNLMKAPGRITSFIKRIRAEYPNMKIHEFSADYERSKAEKVALANIDKFSDVNIVYCANDHMALGVLDVLERKGIKKRPIVIGYDSILEAQQAILSGKMSASIIQFPSKMGAEAVRSIVALSKKEFVPRRIIILPKITIRKQYIESANLEDIK